MNEVCAIHSRALRLEKHSPAILQVMSRGAYFANSAGQPLQWPSFNGQSTLVGTSPSGRVSVYVDSSLGTEALKNANDLLADADRIVQFNDATFGTNSGRVDVILFALGGATDGTGGADHMGCDYVTGAQIEVCVAYGQSARCSALFEAELSECAMGGNLCGMSTGEALSRRCATDVSSNALADFASAPSWAKAGYPNFVDSTDPSDQNYPSIGCGMAFISWLISKGHSLAAIARAMVSLDDSGTLAELYGSLTITNASPWQIFLRDVQALPNGITNDDPFAGVTPSQPPPQPPGSMLKTKSVDIATRSAQKLGGGAGGIIALLWPIIQQILASILSGGNILPCLPGAPTTPTGHQLQEFLANPNPWQEMGYRKHVRQALRRHGLNRTWEPAITVSSKESARDSTPDECLACFREANGS